MGPVPPGCSTGRGKHAGAVRTPQKAFATGSHRTRELPGSHPIRYLLNGPGGPLGPVLWVLFCTVSTLSQLPPSPIYQRGCSGEFSRSFPFRSIPGSADDMAGVAPSPSIGPIQVCLSPSSASRLLGSLAAPRSQPAVEILCGIIVGGAVIFLYTGVAPVILSVVAENAGADDASADGQA